LSISRITQKVVDEFDEISEGCGACIVQILVLIEIRVIAAFAEVCTLRNGSYLVNA